MDIFDVKIEPKEVNSQNCPKNYNDLQLIQSDLNLVHSNNNIDESYQYSEKEKSDHSSEKTVNLFDILNNTINQVNFFKKSSVQKTASFTS